MNIQEGQASEPDGKCFKYALEKAMSELSLCHSSEVRQQCTEDSEGTVSLGVSFFLIGDQLVDHALIIALCMHHASIVLNC